MTPTRHDRPEPPRQNVTATGGFAYGVIGADIHVFGDGVPVYVLRAWRSAPDVEQAWLRALPSRMLNARFGVVEFTGRQDELADLQRWRDSDPRLAVRWLHGYGGAGKTRLAEHLAAASVAAGWKVVVAEHGPGMVLPPPGSQDLVVGDHTGVLLVVEYADRWPTSHLKWLLSNGLLHQADVPTRVLLLARTPDAWPEIRASLVQLQADTSSQPLADLPPDGEDRPRMFAVARRSFARLYAVDRPEVIQPSAPLDSPDLGLTLAIHIVALVAVDAHVHGRRAPRDLAGLTVYLLDREHLHWANLYGDPTHRLDGQPAIRTPPRLMNQVVFAAALTGAVTPDVGTSVLHQLRLPAPLQQALRDHAVCYPPTDDGRRTVLEPLYPDRLAEDFLALTMPGHDADYPAQAWAATVATDIVGSGGQTASAHAPRAITFLASAADRWPHLAHGYLYPIARSDPACFVSAGSAALEALAAIGDIDVEALEAVERHLPADRSMDLDVGAAAIVIRLATHRLAVESDAAVRARLLFSLSWSLGSVGRHQEALGPALESVAVRRALAAEKPAHRSTLAVSLHALGVRFAEVGRYADALTATEEAAAIRRHLATAGTATALAELAGTLGNLASYLSEVGRHRDALPPLREAVDIKRRLTRDNPGGQTADLALSLNNLGMLLSDLGCAPEALSVGQEAVDLYLQLTQTNPDMHRPALAAALGNLGVSLHESGRDQEALTVTIEAVATYRTAARLNAAYQPELAGMLRNLAHRHADLGQPHEALAASEESVSIRRRLARALPAANLPHLASELNGHALRLATDRQHAAALAATEEALKIYRSLMRSSPDVYRSGFAQVLNNLGTRLSAVGRQEEALTATREALAVRRTLADTDPELHLPDVAASLTNLSIWHGKLGQRREALDSAREAVQIYRRCVTTNPVVHLPRLATALNNLSVTTAELGMSEAALPLIQEAISMRRQLADANPGRYLPDLAKSLMNLAMRLRELGDLEASIEPASEAVELRRRLARADPSAHLPELANALNNLGVLLAATPHPARAMAPGDEAVKIYRQLAAKDPELHRLGFATAAWVYAGHCLKVDMNLAAALSALREASAPLRRPGHWQPGRSDVLLRDMDRTRDEIHAVLRRSVT
ncbi:tetratricopeptide repeat protein [Micromonospora sp. L32]|uniref:tetratricopeptide repeat protein n=1 Tax=Micromonospora sp. L32 TaxID=3452214 RepID=UPI003F8C4811